jgi:hypothetical protein
VRKLRAGGAKHQSEENSISHWHHPYVPIHRGVVMTPLCPSERGFLHVKQRPRISGYFASFAAERSMHADCAHGEEGADRNENGDGAKVAVATRRHNR